jgi:hypothetical protein
MAGNHAIGAFSGAPERATVDKLRDLPVDLKLMGRCASRAPAPTAPAWFASKPTGSGRLTGLRPAFRQTIDDLLRASRLLNPRPSQKSCPRGDHAIQIALRMIMVPLRQVLIDRLRFAQPSHAATGAAYRYQKAARRDRCPRTDLARFAATPMTIIIVSQSVVGKQSFVALPSQRQQVATDVQAHASRRHQSSIVL